MVGSSQQKYPVKYVMFRWEVAIRASRPDSRMKVLARAWLKNMSKTPGRFGSDGSRGYFRFRVQERPISSRDRPLVSGTIFHPNRTAKMQTAMKIQNAYASVPRSSLK